MLCLTPLLWELARALKIQRQKGTALSWWNREITCAATRGGPQKSAFCSSLLRICDLATIAWWARQLIPTRNRFSFPSSCACVQGCTEGQSSGSACCCSWAHHKGLRDQGMSRAYVRKADCAERRGPEKWIKSEQHRWQWGTGALPKHTAPAPLDSPSRHPPHPEGGKYQFRHPFVTQP